MKAIDNPQLDKKLADWLAEADARLADTPVLDNLLVSTPASTSATSEQQRMWACLVQLEKLRRHTCGEKRDESGSPRTDLPPDSDEVPSRLDAAHIDRFEVVSELGRGGCGIVVLARDPMLDRLVALKVPRPEALVTGEMRKRFLNEAKAAASLRHPNVVAVYEVGQSGPICWFAAEYCDGPSLREFLETNHQPIDPKQAARLVSKLADAVDHAHGHGILHRDLKPSNVMLCGNESSEAGRQRSEQLDQYIPKLTDFGLAKMLDRDSKLTQTGTPHGTPSYMAPEQIEHDRGEVARATDVYGLGAILYELLTRLAPFRGNTVAEVYRQVLLDEPISPRRLRPDISPDLEAITLKCLEKSPAHRYSAASELRDDLERFLRDEPTQARPLGRVGQMRKWCRRHPLVVALCAVLLLSIVGFAAGAIWHVNQLQRELAINQRLRSESEQRELVLRREQYLSDMQSAYKAWKEGKLEQTLHVLNKYVPHPGQGDVRDFVWGYLWRRCHNETIRIAGHQGIVSTVRYSPDGKWLATAGHDGAVRVFNSQTGEPKFVIDAHQGHVNCLEFLSKGLQFVTGGDDGMLKKWDIRTGKLVWEVKQHEGDILCLAVHPNGNWIATGGVDKIIRIWDNVEHRERCTLPGHAHWVRGLSFAYKSNRLVSTGHDEMTRCWDISDEKLIWETDAKIGRGLCIAYQPRIDRLVAVGGIKGRIALLNGEDGTLVDAINTDLGWVRSLQFLPTDARWKPSVELAAVGDIPLLQVWNLREKKWLQPVRSVAVHTHPVWSVACSPNVKWIATASGDGLVKIWPENPREDHSEELARTDAGIVKGFLVSHDGKEFAFALSDQVAVWDISTRTKALMIENSGERFENLSAPPDLSWIVTCGPQRPTEIWDRQSGTIVETLPPWADHAEVVTVFPSNADTIALSVAQSPVRLWNRRSRQVIAELPLARSMAARKLEVSLCGRYLAAVETPGELVVWQLPESAEILRIPCDVHSRVGFSRDSKRLAYDAMDRTIRILNLEDRREELRLTGAIDGADAVVFSPDGKLLVSVHLDKVLQFWNLTTGRPTIQIELESDLEHIAFTRDGTSLIVCQRGVTHDCFRILSTGAPGKESQ